MSAASGVELRSSAFTGHCASCGSRGKWPSLVCQSCKTLFPGVSMAILNALLGLFLIAEWYLFYWRVLPMIASLLQSLDGDLNQFSASLIGLVGSIGYFWFFLAPISIFSVLAFSLLWRPSRAVGAFISLVFLVIAHLLTSIAFLLASADGLSMVSRM